MKTAADQKLADDVLYAFLNAYWLRPEHALWFYYDDLEYNRLVPGVDWERSLDLGCGDGVTSFLFNGGRFEIDFDVYLAVDRTVSYEFDAAHDDYYDTFDPDRFSQIPILQAAERTFELGVDYKEGLIRKAAALGLYRGTAQHDFNHPLPFEEGRFSFIFSNTVYHASDVEAHLADAFRVLDRGGQMLMFCPSSAFENFALHRFYHRYGWDWIEHHDRGRYDLWIKSAADLDGWTRRVEAAGFAVEERKAYLPFVVTMIEDIGLRALFPSLHRMAEFIRRQDPQEYLAVKEQWLENVHFLLEPFTDLAWVERARPVEFVWNVFLLRKP